MIITCNRDHTIALNDDEKNDELFDELFGIFRMELYTERKYETSIFPEKKYLNHFTVKFTCEDCLRLKQTN